MIAVRNAVDKDIPRILELYNDLTSVVSTDEEETDTAATDVQHVFNEIRNMPGHELLVAEENNSVIGSMVLLIVPNLSHGALPWAIIENMIVDRHYRRRGIGKLLMEYTINRARQAGCYKVQLLSNKKRTEAHRFYESLGFETSAYGFRLYL